MPASPLIYTPAFLIHIVSGSLALLSGAVALLVRKGSRPHRRFGDVFTIAMLCMGSSSAYIGTMRSQPLNVVSGVLMCYLVATAWLTVRRDETETGLFEYGLLLMALVIGVGSLIWGWQAFHPGWANPYEPAEAFVFFGSVALLAATGDVRVLIRGGVSGGKRLVRHLWRMCFALGISSAAFFIFRAEEPILRRTGLRAKLFSPALRRTHLLEVPVIVVAAVMLFWLGRILFTNVYKTPAEERAEA